MFTARSSDWTNAAAMGKQFKNWDMDAIKKMAGKGLVVTFNSGGGTNREEGETFVQAAPAPNKFRNVITEIDGIKFRSKLEGTRYLQLKMMLRAGLIHDMKMQVPYDLQVNGVHITRYIADFVVTYADGTVVVEDTKGVETEAFKIKKNLMLATLGIEIILVTSNINNNGNISKKSKGRRARRH